MTPNIEGFEYYALQTPILLGVLAVGCLILEITFFRKSPRAVGIVALIGVIITFLFQLDLQLRRFNIYDLAPEQRMEEAGPLKVFGGQIYFDIFGIFFNYLFLLAAIVTIYLTLSYMKGRDDERGEHYILVLLATIGMSLMAMAHNILILFIGIETMSIAVYVLVGMEDRSDKGHEGSLKYLLLGAFASAIFLYGAALLFGTAGVLDYGGIRDVMQISFFEIELAIRDYIEIHGIKERTVYLHMRVLAIILGDTVDKGVAVSYMTTIIGAAMVLIGLFFKAGAVPFHMWTPDVYEGAPTPITGYMATGVKAAAFASLLRIMFTAFEPMWGYSAVYVIVYSVAVMTMCLGNFVAIAQTNIKRMLAYSSIAHAGYLLIGVTSIIASGQYYFHGEGNATTIRNLVTSHVNASGSSIMFYLVIYTLMNLGAFGIISAVQRGKTDGDTLDGFSGLSNKRPGLAALMAVFMFSLAGIPPMAGFAAKFYVFQSAIYNGLYVLAIIGVLNSVVSAYFYLRVIVVMYMQPEKDPLPAAGGMSGAYFISVVMAIMVVLLGLAPKYLLNFISKIYDYNLIEILVHNIRS